jgi:heat shock protein HslJ
VRVPARLAALLVAGSAAACGGGDGSPAAFEGTHWVLTSNLPLFGWHEAPPTATFADGEVRGSTGCNAFHARYEVDGDSLELGEIVATTVTCLPPRDEVETWYRDRLVQVAAWSMARDELVLLDADDRELIRYGAVTFVGDWTVTALHRPGGEAELVPGTEITATFSRGGRLTGSGGCNSYRATYTRDGDAIEISPPAATRKACGDPAGVMEQEAAYLSALARVVAHRLDGDILRLLAPDDTVLVTLERIR